MFREVETQVFLVTMSRSSPKTVALPPCLELDIKDSLKEDTSFFDGLIDWWAAAAAVELC
jgi:hypothetical protein